MSRARQQRGDQDTFAQFKSAAVNSLVQSAKCGLFCTAAVQNCAAGDRAKRAVHRWILMWVGRAQAFRTLHIGIIIIVVVGGCYCQ